MSIKPWPVITIQLVGGPDDGQRRHLDAGKSPEPPEVMLPSGDAHGHYVRHPEPVRRWEWRYLWMEGER